MSSTKIIVFGAAGRTGKYIVECALEAGYPVTAFVHRNKSAVENPNLTIIEGDVHDKEKVKKAIHGQDVVISALGTEQIEGDAVNLMSDAMKIFAEVMNEYGIKRVLAIGGLGVLQWNETMQLLDKPDYPALYKNVGEGHNKVYKVLRGTNLDWTFVCCPDLVEAPRSGKYNVKKDYPASGIGKINRGDVADFILKEMEERNFNKNRVGINNY